MADEELEQRDTHGEDVEAHLLAEDGAPRDAEEPRRARIEIEPMDF